MDALVVSNSIAAEKSRKENKTFLLHKVLLPCYFFACLVSHLLIMLFQDLQNSQIKTNNAFG